MKHPKQNRALTESEQALWDQVIKQVESLNTMPTTAPAAPTKLVKPTLEPPAPISMFQVGEKSKPTKQPFAMSLGPAQTSPNMDRRNFQRLLKGKLDIDATIDLHGMTTEQAHAQLMRFVINANRMGYRLLLIITGKGKKTSRDEFNRPKSGVIKAGVPEWLKSNALSGLVLQITQAQPKHGGGGAYYVYLRRKRQY